MAKNLKVRKAESQNLPGEQLLKHILVTQMPRSVYKHSHTHAHSAFWVLLILLHSMKGKAPLQPQPVCPTLQPRGSSPVLSPRLSLMSGSDAQGGLKSFLPLREAGLHCGAPSLRLQKEWRTSSR